MMLVWEWFQRMLAALLLLPAAVVVVLAGLLIRVNSPGPILVRLTREGKNGEWFPLLKLRTMVPDADAVLVDYLATHADRRREWDRYGRLKSDPRVAGPVASLARRFSIDELPQLFNVVRGEMNLVGPRPLPPQVATGLAWQHRTLRQRVLPGMTGLWQVSGRSELTIASMGRLDSFYIRRRSILLDIFILWQTPRAAISGAGAY